MRQRLFLHYRWFLHNLSEGFIRTNMHTTVLPENVYFWDLVYVPTIFSEIIEFLFDLFWHEMVTGEMFGLEKSSSQPNFDSFHCPCKQAHLKHQPSSKKNYHHNISGMQWYHISMTHMLFCYVIPNWHGGSLLSPCCSGIGFCQLIFYQKCPNLLVVKIDIIWINLTPRQAHRVL